MGDRDFEKCFCIEMVYSAVLKDSGDIEFFVYFKLFVLFVGLRLKEIE